MHDGHEREGEGVFREPPALGVCGPVGRDDGAVGGGPREPAVDRRAAAADTDACQECVPGRCEVELYLADTLGGRYCLPRPFPEQDSGH